MSSEEPIPYCPERHGPVPARFVNGCKGDVEEGQRRWAATAEWRLREDMDGLLARPHPRFADLKRCYPTYVHGKAKNGFYVYYERCGMADFTALNEMATMDELLQYYLYSTEWVWRVLDQREEGKLVSVWDVAGASASSLVGDRMQMLRNTMAVMAAHYPERSDKLFIVNAPFWFSGIWRAVNPWIDPNTRGKIEILGTNYQAKLCSYIGSASVPVLFGGDDPTPLGESTSEKQLHAFVAAAREAQATRPTRFGPQPPLPGLLVAPPTTDSKAGPSPPSAPAAEAAREEEEEEEEHGSWLEGALRRAASCSSEEGQETDYESASDGYGRSSWSLSEVVGEDDAIDAEEATAVRSGRRVTWAAGLSSNGSSPRGGEGVEEVVEEEEEEAFPCETVSVSVLAAHVLAVEEATRALDSHARETASLEATRRIAKAELDEVVGRKAGLGLQTMTFILSDMDLAVVGRRQTAEPLGRRHAASSVEAADAAAGGPKAAEEEGGVGGGDGAAASTAVSLTLTMQLERVRREAETLVSREKAAKAKVLECEALHTDSAAQAATLLAAKRAASRRLSALLATAVSGGGNRE